MPSPDMLRMFVAIELSERVRQNVAGVLADLDRIGAAVRWVKPENLHLTLKFLGDVEEHRLSDLFAGTEEALRGGKAFQITFRGLGAFPHLRRPRVFWIGIEQGAERLKTVQQRIESRLAELGFSRDTKAFAPHLTLGRVKKNPRGIAELASAVERMSFGPEEMSVERVVVMKSVLTPEGPNYSRLRAVPLLS